MERSAGLPSFSLPAFLLAPWPVPARLQCAVRFRQFGAAARDPSSSCVWRSGSSSATSARPRWSSASGSSPGSGPVTKTISVLTGVALAATGYLPVTFVSWHASGPDSGPPTENFFSYVLRNWNDPFLGFFLAGGLVAAVLYDTLARRRIRKPATA